MTAGDAGLAAGRPSNISLRSIAKKECNHSPPLGSQIPDQDVAADFRKELRPMPATSSQNGGSIRVHRTLDDDLRRQWKDLEADAVHTSYQSAAWYDAWLQTAGAAAGQTPLIIAAYDDQQRLRILLPLVCSRYGGLRIGRFPGEKHSNLNFPVLRKGQRIAPGTIDGLVEAVRRDVSGVDLLVLDALPESWDELGNPLVPRSAMRHSADGAFLLLDADQAVAYSKKRRAARKRLKHAGAVITLARTRPEIEDAVTAFLRQKAAWFRSKGYKDPFVQTALDDFFIRLFLNDGSGGECHCLSIGTEIVAVAALLATPTSAVLLFTSFDRNSPLSKHGPGTFLLEGLVDDLRKRGIARFDLGLGEADYKYAFGAAHRRAYAAVQPLTFKGWLVAPVFRLKYAAIRLLKRMPFVLTPLRKLLRFASLRRRSRLRQIHERKNQSSVTRA